MKTDKITQQCGYLADKHNAEFARTYGEPGYSDTPRGVILANWNNSPRGLADWLESAGFSLEWSDEWTIHDEKAYRTSPDCYSWQPALILSDDGEYIGPDDGAECAIDECANTDKGQPAKCLPHWVCADDLRAAGFAPYSVDNESGHFPGQTDSPAARAAEAFDHGARRVVFLKTEQSQFYCKWQAWAEFDVPEYERFDICAAYAQIENDYNIGGILKERGRAYSVGVQLARMKYRPGSNPMNMNAWAIYRALQLRYGFAS